MGRVYMKGNGTWIGYNANSLFRKEGGQWVEHDWSVLDGRKYLYEYLPAVGEPVSYVSLGDSIAAGHTINAEWADDYGEGSQYGKNGNATTKIVSGSYTDLIRNELVSIYGENGVSVQSFARSGDTVADLMAKLSHDAVRNAIAKADLVTICIGANDVLQPAVTRLEEYISTGSLSSAEAVIEANMANLNTDAHPTSYTSMFNKLMEINSNAKYVLTTVYNPYKYLHLDDDREGFFGPLLAILPDIELDIDEIIEDMFLGGTDLSYFDALKGKWVSIELSINLTDIIRDVLLSTSFFQLVFGRVNGLGAWSEVRVCALNEILRNKITAYRNVSQNFSLADTKALFDLFPDKTETSEDVDYSDLVNVEFTHTFDTAKMDWGALWRKKYGGNATQFWIDLAMAHTSFTNGFPSTNVADYVSFDLEGFATDLTERIVENVILPDTDPHPEYQGHQVLKRSFTNALGLVRYDANGGSHAVGDVVLFGDKLQSEDPAKFGYNFGGWYADEQLNQPFDKDSAALVDYAENFSLSDLVDGGSVKPKTPKTTTLYAKWLANN